MKILIDGQTLLTPEINRGIGIYFRNCIEKLLESDFTNDFYINTPNESHLNVFSPWVRNKLCRIEHEAYDIRPSRQAGGKHLAELYTQTLHRDIEQHGRHAARRDAVQASDLEIVVGRLVATRDRIG